MNECRKQGALTAHLLERRERHDVLEFWYAEKATWIQGTRPSSFWDDAEPCEWPEGSR